MSCSFENAHSFEFNQKIELGVALLHHSRYYSYVVVCNDSLHKEIAYIRALPSTTLVLH